jgi:L-rhamnose mutarotase
MKLLEKTDEEILKIANPLWDNLVKSSNIKDYSAFTKDFSAKMLFGANEIEIGKQWANNKLLTSLSKKKKFFGCLRRNEHVTVLYKQTSDKVPGEFLGRLVLGMEDDKVKIFGATIF